MPAKSLTSAVGCSDRSKRSVGSSFCALRPLPSTLAKNKGRSNCPSFVKCVRELTGVINFVEPEEDPDDRNPRTNRIDYTRIIACQAFGGYSMRRSGQRASRRQVLQSAAGAIGGLTILRSAKTAFSYQANDRLRLAVVGMAGYGAWHGFTEALHTYGNVEYSVSCDVDRRKVQKVYELWDTRAKEWPASPDKKQQEAAKRFYVPLSRQRPLLFADFRRMLDEAAEKFDAVVIATPDHTHAVIAAAALR